MSVRTIHAQACTTTRMVAIGFIALLECGSRAALAAAPTASGMAYDLNVNVSVAGNSILAITPVDQVQFANQAAAYADQQTTPSFDSGVNLVARLTTGVLDTQTQWIPASGFLAVGSQATANNVDLNAVDAASSSLLSLQASLIQATAIVTGTCPASSAMVTTNDGHLVDDFIFRDGFEPGNLLATSTAALNQSGGGIVLSLLGNSILNVPVNPAPNTSIDLSGITGTNTLVLNEQTTSGDGITAAGVSSNALHLHMNVLGVIIADVIISHAEASIACN